MCHLAIDYPVELVLAKGSIACAQHCSHVKSRAGKLLACGAEQTFMVQCLRPAATYQRSTGFRDFVVQRRRAQHTPTGLSLTDV